MDTTKIMDAFTSLKNDYVVPQMAAIYKKIYQEVRNVEPGLLASKITIIESNEVNSFCLKLNEQAKQTAVKVMKEIGVPETQIPMIWMKVRSTVKTPQAKLCNQQNYATPSPKTAQPANKQPAEPPIGKWIVVSGAAVEVVSWLFLPSGNIWVPIIKGVGLLLVGTGVYKVVQEQKAGPRIELTPEARESARAEAAKAIRDICKQQCALNTGIYNQWLDQICNEVIAECTKLS